MYPKVLIATIFRGSDRVSLLFTVFALLLLSTPYAIAKAKNIGIPTYTFDIQAMEMGEALLQFSEKVDRQFFLRTSLAEGIQSRPLQGRYDLKSGLDILLEGSGLTGELTPLGQIKITRNRGYVNSDYEPIIVAVAPQLEEVLVTGLNYAWQSSSFIKQNSNIIKEVLSESDIGQLPDGNIADSLQRIVGLQIERRNGDGSRFRIRGFDKNVTLYNGEVFLTGLEYFQLGLSEQGYENSIETVPVELLRRVEVYKSIRASDIEGAIGGTVDLISRNAFDVVDYLGAFDMRIDRGEYSESPSPEFFVGIGKNWSDKFAAMLNVNYAERVMHVDIAQNYADRGIEERFPQGILSPQINADGELFEYLRPRYTSLSDIEQTREQSGVSLDLGWRPMNSLSIEAEWFGIYSELNQRNYDLFLGITPQAADTLEIDSSMRLPFLETVDYESNDLVYRTIGEKFKTRANNFDLRLQWDIAEKLRLDTRLSFSDAHFNTDIGNADLLTASTARFLPYWIGDGFIETDFGPISSPTGWLQYGNVCVECTDPDTFLLPLEYNVSSNNFTNFSTRRDFINRAEDTFGAFHQAKGAANDQSAWSVRSDFSYGFGETASNQLAVGFRVDHRDVEFRQYRYLTDFSRTQGAASPAVFSQNGELQTPSEFSPQRPPDSRNVGIQLPVFSDLCRNGGLRENQACDIDGDGFNDNLPYGPWVYQINPSVQADILSFEGRNFYNDLLYGQYFDLMIPGFLPWRPYAQFPEDYVSLDDYFPTGSLSSQRASFVNGDVISNDVPSWIANIAPGAPTQAFDQPRNSWHVIQDSAAFYIETDYSPTQYPITLNAGLRYVYTEFDVTRSVVDNGGGISNTPESWYLSGVGEGWVREQTKHQYHHLLPAANVVWSVSEKWKFRLAASKTISRPNFSQLGQGDSPLYQLVVDFDDQGPFEFNEGVELSTGNPELAPIEITQGDISVEYYGDRGSFAQASVFYKDINGQVFSTRREGPLRDESLEGSTQVPTLRPENGQKTWAKGAELSAQYLSTFGLGSAINFSYIDLDSDIESLTFDDLGLPGVSDKALNWSGFYENRFFRALLSYTWRSESLTPYGSITAVGFETETDSLVELAAFNEAYGQWDARLLFFPTDSLTLSLDWLNITESEQKSYLEFTGNRYASAVWEPRVIFGLQIHF